LRAYSIEQQLKCRTRAEPPQDDNVAIMFDMAALRKGLAGLTFQTLESIAQSLPHETNSVLFDIVVCDSAPAVGADGPCEILIGFDFSRSLELLSAA
jgi:hypothetical protein